MFALVDCNNFFASCEKVFRPDLRNTPVIVLSNNDGCVIARSKEAKQLGIKMGIPVFQIEHLIKEYNIAVFSSNYVLYGDMSNRVMNILSTFTPDIEVYSIDESFLNLSGFNYTNLKEYGKEIMETVTKGTGITVSVGIAPTKTLAKVANKFAKKYSGYKNVCLIDTEEKRIKALSIFPIGDVWGIGREYKKFLERRKIKTAYDFTQLPVKWVKQEMTIVGEKMWFELNGKPCFDLEIELPPKKQICTSRSFGNSINNLEELKESVSTYAAICAEKLRKQKSCATSLMVFIQTNNFRFDLPQYSVAKVITFTVPTSSTLEIVKYALLLLEKIYRPGYMYKKAGVILTEIIPDKAIQQHLFDNINREKHSKLMKVIDKYNTGFEQYLTLAVQGVNRNWKLKREHLSPCYTTRLSDVIKIK